MSSWVKTRVTLEAPAGAKIQLQEALLL